MTPTRRIRIIRRPSIVAVVLGTAALAAVPPSAGVLAGPSAVSSAPTSAPVDGVAALLGDTAALTPAERALREPGSEAVRFNPVAFRLPAAPAASVATIPLPNLPLITTTARPGTAAAAAIEFALAQRGLPYVWGGNGPQRGDAGFDCSGLTTAAYAYAGIRLPRTAHTQYYAGPHVPAGAPLQPGDLVFYGVPQRVHHVGLYIGDGRMVAAPTFGKPVRISYVRYPGDDYLGATRPAAGRDAGPLDPGLLATPDLPVEVPPVPDPTVPPAPEEFLAPEVPAEDLPALPTPPPAATETPLALAEGLPSAPQAPEGPAPGTSIPPSTTPRNTTSPTTTPPTTTPRSATPPTITPPTTTPPTTTSPATTSGTTAPETTTPPATPTGTPAPEAADPGPPTALTLPDGTRLVLTAAAGDADGQPVVPTEPGTAGLRFRAAEDGRAARARISLHPDTATGALVPGAVLVVRTAGGPVELTVRSRATVDAGTAADLASGRGDTFRVVLLRTDPGTGEVLVVIAE